MRSISIALYLLLVVALVPELVQAAPCPDICNSKRVWGFGGASTSFAQCECTDPVVGAFRTGPNGCECNVCYKKEGDGRVTAYGPTDGQCRPGETYCDECELAIIGGSDSGGSTETNTTTSAPPTSTPPGSSSSPTPSSSSPTPLTPSSPPDTSSSTAGTITGAPVSNSSQSGAGDDADTGSTDDSTMATWQIALIICSSVLVFAVVVMTIMSCYCKTRKQMKDNDTLEQETREYENYWHPGSSTAEARPMGGPMGKSLNSSVISAQHTLGGRSSFTSSHSRPNSAKNVPYSEPTFAENDKMGRPPARQSIGSRTDLPQVFNAFPPRPAHELDSRKSVTIEL